MISSERVGQNIIIENIPQELKALPQWVLWQIEKRNGESTKVPCRANGRKADSTEPKTWTTYIVALNAYQKKSDQFNGIGFVFSKGDPYAGIDLDHCLDPETGEIASWAKKILDRLNSYSEVSPSRTGIKVFVRGSLPRNEKGETRHKKAGMGENREGAIEFYNCERYFTLTGQRLEEYPATIEDRDAEIKAIHVEIFAPSAGSKKKEQPSPEPPSLSDEEIIQKARNAKNGEKFSPLWAGDTSEYGGDDSAADCALCARLAFYVSGDPASIDRLFRQSGLYREKWDRDDYRERTIAKALEGLGESYSSGRSSRPGRNGAGLNGTGPDKEDDLIAARGKIKEVLEGGTIEAAFDAADALAQLPIGEYGKVKVQLKEVLGKQLSLRDLERAVKEARKQAAERRAREQRAGREKKQGVTCLPDIEVSGKHLREITGESLLAVLRKNNPPFVFVRGGHLTRIKVDENGHALADPLTISSTRGIWERSANFLKIVESEQGISYVPISPPLDVVNDLLTLADWPGIPPLVGVTTAPVVAPDGTLEMSPGYLPKSRLFYHAVAPLDLGDTTPTDRAVSEAKRLLLEELLVDFPFKDKADKANALSLLILPFVRPLIEGPTPLHLIDASTPGTGKGLLADVVTALFCLSGASIMTASRDDEEWRKRITARLLKGPSHILIDNVVGKLASADLAAAITAPYWEDRILGVSDTARVPVRCIWMGTGNNVQLSDEMTRRVARIRLIAQGERPWERTGFKHSDLTQWVQANRGRLVGAVITLIRKWLQECRPKGNVILGRFEHWSQTMSGILDVIGVQGFMGNQEELYERQDAERQAWVAFLEAWWEKFRDTPVGVAELFALASTVEIKVDKETLTEGQDILAEHLGSGNEKARRTKLGYLLRSKIDRVYGSYRILPEKSKQGAAQYKLDSCGYVNLVNLPQKGSQLESVDNGSFRDTREPCELKTPYKVAPGDFFSQGEGEQKNSSQNCNGVEFSSQGSQVHGGSQTIPPEGRTTFCPDCGRQVPLVEASGNPGWVVTDCEHKKFMR